MLFSQLGLPLAFYRVWVKPISTFSGTVKKQNFCYWAAEKIFMHDLFTPQRLCALSSSRGIIGPYFFEGRVPITGNSDQIVRHAGEFYAAKAKNIKGNTI